MDVKQKGNHILLPILGSALEWRQMHESPTARISFPTEEFDLPVATGTLRVRRIAVNQQRPTIVFLHDSLGCIRLWRDFPERLAASTHCDSLIYDRQGYGESSQFTSARAKDYLETEADVLIALLKKLGLSQSILFGHSDGGSIALIAAAKAPALVAAVITEGAHVFVEDLTLDGIRKVQGQYQSTNLRARLAKYHADKTDAVFSVWADHWLAPDFRDWNMEHYLPAVQCPVLAIQGAVDEFGTERQVDSIVEQVSGLSRKFMIPGVGHTPHKDAAESTLSAVTAFIAENVV
jgi:pimeloyl-ACP methyl ester carboxylesterase